MRNPLEFVVKLFLYLCFFVSLAFASIVWKPLSVHFPDLPATSAISGKIFWFTSLFVSWENVAWFYFSFLFLLAVDVNGSSICGALHAADPLNGCSPLSNTAVAPNEANKTNFILMIRGQCNFSYKIQNAQAAGYHAAIIFAKRKKAPLIYSKLKKENPVFSKKSILQQVFFFFFLVCLISDISWGCKCACVLCYIGNWCIFKGACQGRSCRMLYFSTVLCSEQAFLENISLGDGITYSYFTPIILLVRV